MNGEKRLEEIDATVLKAWVEKNEVVLVDVREPSEHAGERISGARLVPLSNFNPAGVPQEREKGSEKGKGKGEKGSSPLLALGSEVGPGVTVDLLR